jgi:hypothetical protein
MFAAITARLANEDIYGEALNSAVEFGIASGWFSVRGPRIMRAAVGAPLKT